MAPFACAIPALRVSKAIPEHESTDASLMERDNACGVGKQSQENQADTFEESPQHHNSCRSAPSTVNENARDYVEGSASKTQSDTVTNSNRTSFISTLTSLFGCTTFTRGKYYRSNRNSSAGISPRFDYSEAQLNALGLQSSTPMQKSQYWQSVDTFNKYKTIDSAVKGTQTPDRDLKSAKPWLTSTDEQQPQREDGKSLKSGATASCTVLMKEKQAKNQVERTKKAKEEHSQGRNPQYRQGAYCAMPSCYVLSKNKSAVYRRMRSGTQSNINFTLQTSRIGKRRQSRKGKSDDKHDCDVQTQMSPKTRAQERQRDFTTTAHRSPESSKVMQFMRKKWRNDPSTVQASVVTVVNKGSSNIIILKYQGRCKNYMDINPDFGWRRLVMENNSSTSLSAKTSQNGTGIHDESSAQQAYMYYRETKQTTHTMGLAELSINIACRAFILGVAQGIIDDTDLPKFIHECLQQQYGEWDRTNNVHDYSADVVQPREKTLKRSMYLKSSSLGLFAPSSITRILGSPTYREALLKNRRSFMWNIPSKVQESQETSMQHSETPEEPNFYQIIPIPDYGWKLIERSDFDRITKEDKSRSAGRSRIVNALCKIFGGRDEAHKNMMYPNLVLCKIQPPHVTNNKALLRVDVGSIGMNVAEQLYRLEFRQLTREKLPKNTFGFQVLSQDLVISPCGREFKLIPEELILNTATLVHEMYITQPFLVM